MTDDGSDTGYAQAIEEHRPLLQATAHLLSGDPVRAHRLVDVALAQLFERWPQVRDARVEALRSLIRADRRDAHLPWDSSERFDLVDGESKAPVAAIVADLQRLRYDERVVIVLERYAELPTVQIAAVLERSIDEVMVAAKQARTLLVAQQPNRVPDAGLASELRAAVPPELRRAGSTGDDLARGRRWQRRRRLGRSLIGVAAVLLAIVATTIVAPRVAPRPAAGPPAGISTPTSTPSPSRTPCQANDRLCQGQTLIAWRSAMAEVAESHIDPTGRYFSAVDSDYGTRAGTPTIWTDEGGAMAFRLFRPGDGATELYVQIATSRKLALTCGDSTGNPCRSQRFMDGNRFILTSNRDLKTGIEVQYSPFGDQVITAIARNTATKGKVLPLTSSDLIDLVQDPRLRLPER